MNAVQHALPAALPASAEDEDAVLARRRLPVYGLFTVIALLLNCLLGEDLGWDTMHYHLYAGFSALHDRFSYDYFAAGPQSYFNPYVYAPFWGLVHAGYSPFAVSCLLTLAQSSIFWLTYELGVCACPARDAQIRVLSGVCAALLAFLNPILIYQLGSSYADITTAALVVWGWLLLAYTVRSPRPALVIAAGAILGAAVALKLTNAVHAMAAATLLIMVPRTLLGRLRYLAGYLVALAGGFALFAGSWAWRLEEHFRNPFFPLLNNVFRSPEYTTESLRHYRFIPDSLAEALWRPFAIAQPDSMVHVEQIAPDVRYAALLGILVCIVVRALLRGAPVPPPVVPRSDGSNFRVLVALGAGLLADWILWLSESGNGRYFLPMASVTAVLLVALPLYRFALRTCATMLLLIIGLQCVQLYMGTDYRDGDLAWNHPWLQVQLPKELEVEPNLFLSIGLQSNSFVVPYLPRGSGFINFDGMYSLSAQGANGARITELLRRYGTRVRVLVSGSRLHTDAEPGMPSRSRVDDALERLGLRVDPDQCSVITVHGVPAPAEYTAARGSSSPSSPYLQLVSCVVISADPGLLQAHAQRQREVDLILDRLEDTCPALFRPRRMQTQHLGNVWMRYYASTDLIAFLNRGDVKFLGLFRGAEVRYLGHESAWSRAPQALICGRRDEVYFAKLPRSARAALPPIGAGHGS